MDTPIAPILWPEHAARRDDPSALLRMLAHLERRLLEIGEEAAADHVAEAAVALAGGGGDRPGGRRLSA